MIKPMKHGKTYRVRVQRSDRRWQRVTTGTPDRRTAVAIATMVSGLIARREWSILDAVCANELTLGRVWDAYRYDPHLNEFRATLNDVDLEPLVDEWKAYLHARGTLSAARYVCQVRRLIPAGVRFPRSRFTRRVVSEHLSARDVSGSTKNRERAALSVFAKFLLEREALDHNPVRDVQSARSNRPRMRYLDRAQAMALVAALPQPFRALEALMAATGAEWQACARLTRRDIDLKRRTVHLHGGKNHWRDRVVRIVADWALPAIAEHVRMLAPSAPVFTLDHHAALDAHHAACEALQIERCTLHDWRHTFAVQGLRDGLSPTVVASQLGHATAFLTFTTYGRFVVTDSDFASMPSEQVGNRE
jgi:integrase